MARSAIATKHTPAHSGIDSPRKRQSTLVQLPVPASGVSVQYGGTIADPGVPPGTAFTLNTAGMAPCGYALILRVWDRTIVNSAYIGNYNEDSVGFCLA